MADGWGELGPDGGWGGGLKMGVWGLCGDCVGAVWGLWGGCGNSRLIIEIGDCQSLSLVHLLYGITGSLLDYGLEGDLL